MKKIITILEIIFFVAILSIGCAKKDSSKNASEQKYSKSFGEFYVSSKWKENKEHSTEEMFFYVKEGTEKQQQPNNISVSTGDSPYKKEESESFASIFYRADKLSRDCIHCKARQECYWPEEKKNNKYIY